MLETWFLEIAQHQIVSSQLILAAFTYNEHIVNIEFNFVRVYSQKLIAFSTLYTIFEQTLLLLAFIIDCVLFIDPS